MSRNKTSSECRTNQRPRQLGHRWYLFPVYPCIMIKWRESCSWSAQYHVLLLPDFLPVSPSSVSLAHFVWTFVLQKLGRQLIFGKGQQRLEVETDESRKKLRKFKESAWKCIYYLAAELLVLSVTYNEPWFTNTRFFWVGPGNQVWPDQQIK